MVSTYVLSLLLLIILFGGYYYLYLFIRQLSIINQVLHVSICIMDNTCFI